MRAPQNFQRVGTILIIALCLLTTLGPAQAGTGGQNGDYCTQEGARCQRMPFKISSEHLEHDRLLELIRAAELPKSFKNEMIRDLQNTLVIYSDEQLSYAELTYRYYMQITKIEEEVIEDGHNTVRRTVVTREIMEHLPNMGIYLDEYGPGYKAGQDPEYNDIMVRAVTQRYPKKVIYFERVIGDASSEEVMKLVLHEQGHRLQALVTHRNDERIIEGWASSTLEYLLGRKNKSAYFSILKRLGVPVVEKLDFNNRIRLSANQFQADIPISIQPENLLNLTTSRYYDSANMPSNGNLLPQYSGESMVTILQLSREVFQGYSLLEDDDQLLRIYVADLDQQKQLDDILAPVLSGNKSLNVEMRIDYISQVTRSDDHSITTSDKIQNLYASPLMYSDLMDQIRESLSDHTGRVTGILGPWAIPVWLLSDGTNEIRSHAITVANHLRGSLDYYKANDPGLYEVLKEKFLDDFKWVHIYQGDRSGVTLYGRGDGLVVEDINGEVFIDKSRDDLRSEIPVGANGLVMYISPNSNSDEIETLTRRALGRIIQNFREDIDAARLRHQSSLLSKYKADLGFHRNASFELEDIDDFGALKALADNAQLKEFANCFIRQANNPLTRESNNPERPRVTIALNDKGTNTHSWRLKHDWNGSPGFYDFQLKLVFPRSLVASGEISPVVADYRDRLANGSTYQNVKSGGVFYLNYYPGLSYKRSDKGALIFFAPKNQVSKNYEWYEYRSRRRRAKARLLTIFNACK